MTCLQVAAKKLGLRKQDNSYGTCVPFVEQIFIPLANNAENETTEIMTCSKSTANALGSSKRNDAVDVC